MTLQLTQEGMRGIFPVGNQAILDAFVRKQYVLDRAGITGTRRRLTWFFTNIEHECGGFNLNGYVKNLTENIGAYSHQRIAEVWPNRFPGGAGEVARRFGAAPGWQKRAFDEIYGNRMGNRPGTSDGSMFIGRGGPQWTGRDGYEALARYLTMLIPGLGKITAEQAIPYAVNPEYQPEVCAAFWMWKGLNKYADANNWVGLVKAWNGGSNGMADRNAKLAGNDPHIKRLQDVARVSVPVESLPEKPKPAQPTKPPVPPTRDTAGAVIAGGAIGGAAAAGAWSGSYISAALVFGIVAMITTIIIILWRRK